jgi:hypothetical protein
MNKVENLQVHKEQVLNLCNCFCEFNPISDYVSVINDLLNGFLEHESEITHTEAKEMTFNVTTLTTFLVKLTEEVSIARSLEISLKNKKENNYKLNQNPQQK